MVLFQLNFIELDRYGTEFQSYNYNESLYGWKQKTYAVDFLKNLLLWGIFTWCADIFAVIGMIKS